LLDDVADGVDEGDDGEVGNGGTGERSKATVSSLESADRREQTFLGGFLVCIPKSSLFVRSVFDSILFEVRIVEIFFESSNK